MRVTNKLGAKVWQPLARRYGKRGALLLLGLPLALLIGGTSTYAFIALGGGGTTSANAVNLQSGLIGWWKLNGNAKDSTPYANNATVSGATLTTDREGAANSAYSFGTSKDISIGANPSFTHTMPFSVSVWFNASSATSGTLVNKYTSASWNGFNMLFATGGRLCAWYLTGTTNNNYTAIAQQAGVGSVSCPTITTSVWHHVVVTVASTGMQIYLDGSLVASSGWTGTVTNSSETTSTVLGLYQPSVNWFNGSMSDVRIYNRVLSSAEASVLYKEYNPSLNAASGENGLIGWWKLNGNIKDATPNAHNGSINGSPTATSDREGASNGAYSFNGTTDYFQMPGGSFFNVAPGQAKTYSIWFKASAPSATNTLFWEQGGCIGWNLYMTAGGQIAFQLTTGNTTCTGYNSYVAQTPLSYSDNNWHLATAVVDRPGGNEYLYIDGSLKISHAIDNTYSNTGGTLRIGTNWNNSLPLTGSLSDARIYGRALSATDITNLYKSYNSQISLYQSSGSGVNLSSGLVGEWDFTGNAKDSTPYSDNGVVSGATLTNDRFNNSNSAYAFNAASSQYISVADSSTLRFGTGDFTIAAWVQFPINGTSAWDGIISKGYATTAIANTWGLIRDSNLTNGVTFQDVVTGGSWNANISKSSISNGWHHIVITRTGGVYTMYFDGSFYTSQSTPAANLSTTAPILIGQESSRYLTGSIDDIRLYKRALSAAEVSALHSLSY